MMCCKYQKAQSKVVFVVKDESAKFKLSDDASTVPEGKSERGADIPPFSFSVTTTTSPVVRVSPTPTLTDLARIKPRLLLTAFTCLRQACRINPLLEPNPAKATRFHMSS